jgi:Holliday junction resolvase RusA-like endonuclease
VRQNGGRLYEGAVKVTCRFYGAHKGADIDNLCKAVLDAANLMVIRDDRQVMELHAYKLEVPDGETARTEVEIAERP